MCELSPELAAVLGRSILQAKNPEVTVTRRSVIGLLETGALKSLEEDEVRRFFEGIHVLTGSGIEVVRVSLAEMSDSEVTDPRPYGATRQFAGVDFSNQRGLSKQERRDAWTGVWPVSARNLAIAALGEKALLGVIRGFVSPKLARIVTGSTLDVTTGRHWIQTRKMTPEEREVFFPNGTTGAWVMVQPGPVAAIEEL
ncbi:hypothetical protein ICL81_10730 [Leucobacter sp. cx-328]|uniref:hypothetical protein n=1 Tax=unclassified Leucobacter TaxID=2621730 RepID=UPI00165E51FC|nr:MULTISPECIES: hypothetical protein [unclassified Leucobacter]MBC9944977.1 hypothetical protein [Leucobacter sp. cx-328]